jgi:hypothetical protein
VVTDTPIAPTPAPVCWAMYPRPSRHGWANSVLIAPNGARYHLGHNGLRLARSSDVARLRSRRPDVLEWVAATLAETPSTNSRR